MSHVEYCDHHVKRRFVTKAEAAVSIKKRGLKNTRIYRCPDCDGFHMTRSGPRAKAKGKALPEKDEMWFLNRANKSSIKEKDNA